MRSISASAVAASSTISWLRSAVAVVGKLANYDFCPWANRYVYWLREPIGWFVIGASIFASNVGSEHIVGLAGEAAKNGLVLGHYELHSWLCLLLGWVFVPFYLRSRVFTMPEFLERRFSPGSRWLLSITMLIGYVLTKTVLPPASSMRVGKKSTP